MLPKDPSILLSYINTQLRDFYGSLEELCQELEVDMMQLKENLQKIDYEYDSKLNQFV